jgi:hypothetical protein
MSFRFMWYTFCLNLAGRTPRRFVGRLEDKDGPSAPRLAAKELEEEG